MIDATVQAGVKRVYYTSLTFGQTREGQIENSTRFAVVLAHSDTEQYLKASGLMYTIIREGIYAESWPLYVGVWRYNVLLNPLTRQINDQA